MLLGIVVLASLAFGGYLLARVAVAVEVACVLGGWYAAQAPYITKELGIASPAAPETTIVTFLWISFAGAVVLVPSLMLLFAVFKRTPIKVD